MNEGYRPGPDIGADGEIWQTEDPHVRADNILRTMDKHRPRINEDDVRVVERLTRAEKDRVVAMTKAFDEFYSQRGTDDFDRLFHEEGGLRWLLRRIQSLA